MEISTTTLIVICSALGAGIILIICLSCSCYYYLSVRGRSTISSRISRPLCNPSIFVSPPPGRIYTSPVTVTIQSIMNDQKGTQIPIYVKTVHANSPNYSTYQRHGENPTGLDISFDSGGRNKGLNSNVESNNSNVSPSAEEDSLTSYLLYRNPLTLIEPGDYIVRAHTLYNNVSDVRQFFYRVASNNTHTTSIKINDGINRYSPIENGIPAPRIIPGSGEVSTCTFIKIVSDSDGYSGHEVIKYSTDGSYPLLMYTGPFMLPISSVDASGTATVRAIICDSENVSPEATSRLLVVPPGVSIYDATIPAPVSQVDASEALLYFESAYEGTPQANTTAIHYRIEYAEKGDNRKKTSDIVAYTQVYQNKTIPITSDVSRILAWTVPIEHSEGGIDDIVKWKRSDTAIYDVSLQKFVQQCKQISLNSPKLKPPVICVSCNDLYITFDDPPADYTLLYTLDGTDPIAGGNTSTHRFLPGSNPIHLSQYIKTSMVVTARYFTTAVAGISASLLLGSEVCSQGDGRGVVRFGSKFCRGFHFEE